MKILAVVILFSCINTLRADDLNVSELSQRLKDIEYGTAVDEIQAEFNRVPYTTKTENGTELLQGIQTNLERSLTALTDVLRKVKKAVVDKENAFSTGPTPFPLCCDNTGNYKYDPKFRKEVDFSTACVTKSPVASTDAKYPNDAVGNVMRENYNNNKNVLWQHYGTTDGVSIMYPSAYWTDCVNYDPRFRSAFASTASPKDKDVVIILDASSSMKQISGDQSRSKMVIAKDAARTVIETLNPNDRVAVISFSTDIGTPDPTHHECYEDTLAFASKANIDNLKEYVVSIIETNNADSNFENALLKAFSYLGSSNWTTDVSSRDQVILFLTDGGSDAGRDPREVIRDENAKLQNRVIVFTYLLGSGASDDVKSQLNEMATQVNSNMSHGVIKEGVYKYVDLNQHKTLSMEMATFYVHLHSNTMNPIYTIPYVDPLSGKGLITSMCIPVIISSGLHGVACTDVRLSDLLKEVEYFEEGNSSFGFVIDNTGRALVHPLLPDATFVLKNEDPVLVDITTLERSSGSADIIDSMKRGETGMKTLQAVYFTVPRGRLVNDGSSISHLDATYFWGPVANTNFYICIVLGDNSHSEISENQFPLSLDKRKDSFLYHNRSLATDSFQDCRFNSRKVTLAKSSIKLTPAAFTNPFQYIDKDETQLDVKGYMEYFTKQKEHNPGFKASVRPTIWATYKAEEMWKERPAKHLAWRYIGTKAGFIRVYPAVSLTKNYDHEKRTWWRQTTSHPGMIYITRPYLDAWGSGVLITMGHTIHKKGSTQVIAVVCTDFPFEYFSRFIHQIFPTCTGNQYKCMIIDDSGFLVMHRSFKESRDPNVFENSFHITLQEPAIANAMIKQGVLNSQECQDFSENKELKSFRVTLPFNKQLGVDFGDTGDTFELRPVAETNIFILRIITGSTVDVTTHSCTCGSNLKPDYRQCNCDCLCYKPITFNVCKNTYTISLSDGSLPCSARLPDTSGISIPEELDDLPTCFNPQCPTKQSKSECFSEAECGWCDFTDEGFELNPKCCRPKEDCSFGKTTSTNRDTCDAITSSTSEPWGAIGGAAGGGIIITLISIGLLYLIKRKKICHKKSDPDPYIDAVPDITYASGELDLFDQFNNDVSSGSTDSNYTKPPPYQSSSNYYTGTTFNHIVYDHS